jgi:mannose-6-phosphate isomerase-like protein (cupin superfamily)
MQNIQKYIDSGILELYVLDITTETENQEIAKAAADYIEIKKEINKISAAMEKYALENAVKPDPIVKPFIMAKIDFYEKLRNGNNSVLPPVLNEHSRISDFDVWVNSAEDDMPVNFQNFHTKIIGISPEVTTAIVWIKYMAPEEIHHNEIEKFLILEGTCDIRIEDEVFSLKAGDYYTIPMNKKHDVKITSSIPCKAILQRIAA